MSQDNTVGGLVEKSRYLKRFQKLASDAPGAFRMEGDLLLIEALPKLEKEVTLAGGTKIVIADAKTHKQTHNDLAMEFGLVIMAGPGDIYEGERLEMNCKVGEVVLLPGNVAWYSQFGSLANYEPYTLGVVRDASILVHLTDYEKAFEVLNG